MPESVREAVQHAARHAAPLAVGAVGLIVLLWGLAHVAGHDEADPATFLDYLPAFAGLAAAAGAAAVLLAPGPGRHSPGELRPKKDEWAEVVPRYSARRQAVRETIASAVWNLVGLPLGLHYLFSGDTARGTLGVVVILLLMGLGVAAAAWAVYRYLRLQRAEEARLLVYPQRISLGAPLSVRFDQEFLTEVHIERARVGVLCLRRGAPPAGNRGTASPPVFEAWKESAIDRNAKRGRKLHIQDQIELPATGQPSVSHGGGASDYDWVVRLVIKLADGPDYQAEFPIPVHPRPRAQDRVEVD